MGLTAPRGPFAFSGRHGGRSRLPWNPKARWTHSKKASTPKLSRQAAHVANSMLKRGFSEERAVRAANSVVRKSKARVGRLRAARSR
jgi:hypothetical protein